MRAILPYGCRSRWLWGFILGVFSLMAYSLAQGLEGRAQGIQRDASSRWARVTVDRGRLSVDLRQADIQTVLAQIGEQAGIAILTDATDRRTISAQFSDAELETGLRRLLKLASLDYTILYTRGPTGAATIKEVHVFGGKKDRERLQPIAGQPVPPENPQDHGLLVAPPSAQTPEAPAPPAGAGENEGARRFLEALQRARVGASEEPSPATQGAAGDAMRSLLKAFQRQSD